MSTAIERIMRERGDLTNFHEPFLRDYYEHRATHRMPMLDTDSSEPETYESVRDAILGAAETGPVFFKDMSYYVVPRIFDDRDFARRMTNSFLIRDPRRSIVSYHRLDPEMTSVEIGLETQWRHFAFVRDRLGQEPVVIEAERVQDDPEGMMRAFWQRVGLPFRREAFKWRARETPEDWQHVQGWHAKVLDSTGIAPPDEDAEAAFDEAAFRAPRLRQLLIEHKPYYEKLKAFSLAPDHA